MQKTFINTTVLLSSWILSSGLTVCSAVDLNSGDAARQFVAEQIMALDSGSGSLKFNVKKPYQCINKVTGDENEIFSSGTKLYLVPEKENEDRLTEVLEKYKKGIMLASEGGMVTDYEKIFYELGSSEITKADEESVEGSIQTLENDKTYRFKDCFWNIRDGWRCNTFDMQISKWDEITYINTFRLADLNAEGLQDPQLIDDQSKRINHESADSSIDIIRRVRINGQSYIVVLFITSWSAHGDYAEFVNENRGRYETSTCEDGERYLDVFGL